MFKLTWFKSSKPSVTYVLVVHPLYATLVVKSLSVGIPNITELPIIPDMLPPPIQDKLPDPSVPNIYPEVPPPICTFETLPKLELPTTVKLLKLPTWVICGWVVLTLKVVPVNVNPVPASYICDVVNILNTIFDVPNIISPGGLATIKPTPSFTIPPVVKKKSLTLNISVLSGPYWSASVARTILVVLAYVYTPFHVALASSLTKIRVPTVWTLALSINSNTPVVLMYAPTPSPGLSSVYEVLPLVTFAKVVVVAVSTGWW